MNKIGRRTYESGFSKSKLWKLQKDYYKSLVVSDAWGKNVIPFFNTSNNFIANKYAQLIKKILDKTDDTLYILELGSGHGRFGYLLQNALKNLYKNESKPYHYIMSDISQKNIDMWNKHPKFTSFIEEKNLDFVLFDISLIDDNTLKYANKSLSSMLKNKNVLVISNFVTSALAFDIFNIKDHTLFEVSATYDKNIENLSAEMFHKTMQKTKLSFEINEVNSPYYENKNINDIVEYYKNYFDKATIDIPVDMIQTIEYFKKLSSELSLLLSDDANLSLEFFDNRKAKVFQLKSGSFSNRINLDAFSRFTNTLDLNFISPTVPNPDFDTYMFMLDKFMETNEFQNVIESYNANDFSILYNQLKSGTAVRSKEVLALFKMSHYDTNIIQDFYEKLLKMTYSKDKRIRDTLKISLQYAWQNYYDIGESFDVGFAMGRLFRRLKEYDSALICLFYSLEKDNTKYNIWYYLGLCFHSLQKYEEAIEYYQKSIEIKGKYDSAENNIKKCQEALTLNTVTKIDTQEKFQLLARNSDVLGFKDMAVCKFIIVDVDTSKPKLYFMNTKEYEHHYLYYKKVLGYDILEKEFDKISYYTNIGRKNLAGSIVVHPNFSNNEFSNGVYALEFWPSDPITFTSLNLAWSMINDAMEFSKGKFIYHLSSPMQIKMHEEEVESYKKLSIPVMDTDTLFNNIEYIPLNLKSSYGILKILEKDEVPSIQDIVILKDLPNDLSHVRGIISDTPQTPLSHVNLKAKQNKIPNAYVKNASSKKEFLDLVGKPVHLQVSANSFTIKEVSFDTLMDKLNSIRPKDITNLDSNLSYKNILNLEDISDKSDGFGAKASNMGILYEALEDPFRIEGMAIPFSFYNEFMKYNKLDKALKQLLEDKSLERDVEYKDKKLLEFRTSIENANIPGWMTEEIKSMQAEFPERSDIRLRSSSNNEDMPEFNGAGLYGSELFVYSNGLIEESIKKVWSSLWSYRAFEERSFHKINHNDVAMAILVHQDISHEKYNGVAVSKNLYNKNYDGIYINAQHGEALVTNPDAQELSDELLVSASGKDMKYEIQYIRYSNLSNTKDTVMSEHEVMVLLKQTQLIDKIFKHLLNKQKDKEFAMELEFLMSNEGDLKILQARPWLD